MNTASCINLEIRSRSVLYEKGSKKEMLGDYRIDKKGHFVIFYLRDHLERRNCAYVANCVSQQSFDLKNLRLNRLIYQFFYGFLCAFFFSHRFMSWCDA